MPSAPRTHAASCTAIDAAAAAAPDDAAAAAPDAAPAAAPDAAAAAAPDDAAAAAPDAAAAAAPATSATLFRSPRRSHGEVRCYVQIDVSAAGLQVTARLPSNPGDECAWPIAPTPRCSPAAVWKRAQAAGAHPENRGYVRFILRKSGPVWEFAEMGRDFDVKIPDDCP